MKVAMEGLRACIGYLDLYYFSFYDFGFLHDADPDRSGTNGCAL